MKRPLSKTAAILNIVLYSVYLVSCLFYCFIAIDLLRLSATLGGIFLVAALIIATISILQIVFGAKILKICGASKQEYANKKGVVIASIVFSFIVCLFIIIGFFEQTEVISIVFGIIFLGGFITSNIFLLIDLSKNKKLPDGEFVQQPQFSDTSTVVNNNYDHSQQPTKPQTVENNLNTNTFEAKLSKLNLLKEQGVLSEHEFNSLKAKLIEKELNK